MEVTQMENVDWEGVAYDKRKKLLDDVPLQIKKACVERSVLFGKTTRTEDTREKQLDTELPWSAIDPKDRPEFIEAEKKQWREHLQFEAVLPEGFTSSSQHEDSPEKPVGVLWRFSRACSV